MARGVGVEIGITGASGNAGQGIYAEAVRRGNETTAVVRNPGKERQLFDTDADIVHKDAFELVRRDPSAFHAVVDAFSVPSAQAHRPVDLAPRLVALLRETTTPRPWSSCSAREA